MKAKTICVALGLSWALCSAAFAQGGRAAPEELRRQVERRFEVVVVRDGLVLRADGPGRGARGARTVEVSGGTIIVDGAPATGAELRDTLGADADLVLQLSYLDVATQRALFTEAGRGVAPGPERPAAQPDLEPPDRREGARNRQASERIRIGGSVRVESDELIRGDVVAVGGSARVFGEVRGDVAAIGGVVELGPTAIVRGDVTVVGGTLRRDPGARIEGETHEIGIGAIDMSDWRFSMPSLAALWWGWTLSAVYSLVASIVRVSVLCLLAALVMLVARDYVERVSARAAAEPFKAGAIGFLAQVLFIPILVVVILLLVVTIIGIPLLVLVPFAILGLGIFGLIGFTAVGYHLGRLLTARLGWTDAGPFAATIAGILLVVSPVLVARLIGIGGGVLYPMTVGLGLVGVIVEYVAWTVGFGAVALARFGRPAAN
ncbi:MAG: hypothetical protein A3H97_01610 [Acidobacteria bacterium RIFCSPLOWO2_02_FULL_65_29]|nr:MAG: hypothetical protein A3H97_01610 [Acidobacteria bacterium RIFCSPLOWO2_02_FULL_65_29]